MQEQYYNLPMVRENFVSRNFKKLFQGFFTMKSKKRHQKRIERLKKKNEHINAYTEAVMPDTGVRQRVDIYEFQNMYKRGEIPIENMNEDQKYALVKLFEMQNEKLRASIEIHQRNTDLYNQEVEKLKNELKIIG